MADIQIVMEVIGEKSIVSAAKSTVSLENTIKSLSKSLEAGRVNEEQFSTALKELRQGLDGNGRAWQTNKAQIDRYVKGLQAATKAQEEAAAADQKAKVEAQQFAKVRKEATEANRQFDIQQKKTAIATQQAAAEEERLKNKFVEGYAAMNLYSKELNDLAVARRANLITTEHQTAAVARLNKEMQTGTGRFSGYGAAAQMATKRSNQLGVVTQQAGYQIGDFLVQIQSGTNPLVAFGQQATQLVGILPLMGAGFMGLSAGALVALSAGLGIAIPLVTALGAAMMRAGGSAKTLKDSLTDLEETNEILKDFGKDFGKNLIGNIEAVRATFGDLVADIYEAQIRELQSKLSKEFSSGWFAESFAKSFTAIKPSTLSGFDQGQINRQAQQELEIQNILNGLVNAKVSSMSELSELYTEAYQKLKLSGAVSEEGLTQLQKKAVGLGLHLELMGDIVDKEKDLADVTTDEAEALKKVNEYQQSLLWKQDEEVAKKLQAQGFELKALALRKQSAYEQAYANVMAKAASEEQKAALIDAAVIAGRVAEESVQVAYETERAKDSAEGLSDALKESVSAMSSLVSFSSGLDKALAVSIAKVEALKAGANAAIAGQAAGRRFELEGKIGDLVSSGVDRSVAEKMFGGDRAKIERLKAYETESKRLEEANRKSNGGKSEAEQMAERIAKFEEQLRLQEALIGKTEAHKQVIQALGVEFVNQNSAATAKYEAEIERITELTRLEQERKALMESISSTLESGFMSMIDGTSSVKDAFKNMAREIIKELYRVLVVQRLVGSFDAKTKTGTGLVGMLMGAFQANGGAWSGGSQIQAYANGGVVGGPTLFPMAGGKTGLMGEAGPEAIMPLKRDKNGKLGVSVEGGSGSVVVNNNINVTGGSDPAAIRMEVAKLMPQITSATKSAVIDARRRGGQMKSAFS